MESFEDKNLHISIPIEVPKEELHKNNQRVRFALEHSDIVLIENSKKKKARVEMTEEQQLAKQKRDLIILYSLVIINLAIAAYLFFFKFDLNI